MATLRAFKREREYYSSDEDEEDMGMSVAQRGRVDMGDVMLFKIQKLQRCNVRRHRRCKMMERRIEELEKQMEEMRGRVSFLEAVSADYERENEYFRRNYLTR